MGSEDAAPVESAGTDGTAGAGGTTRPDGTAGTAGTAGTDGADGTAGTDGTARSDGAARPGGPDGTAGANATPGAVRPGGRTARVRTAVLRAAGDVLAEQGFDRLDLADVARRAEVGKTTVYRRWGTTGALAADLLEEMAEQSLPRTGTGSLLGDLEANARLVQSTLSDPRQGPLFRALLAAATCDGRTAEALHRFYDTRVREWAPCVEEAVERGEVPVGTDAHEVIRAVSAPLYYRMLTTGAALDERDADRAAGAAAAAARAGVHRR